MTDRRVFASPAPTSARVIGKARVRPEIAWRVVWHPRDWTEVVDRPDAPDAGAAPPGTVWLREGGGVYAAPRHVLEFKYDGVGVVREEELVILRMLAATDQCAYQPWEAVPEAWKAFDELVDTLRRMQRARWIELEAVRFEQAQDRRYRRKWSSAIARITSHGRHALGLLGESAAS